jgi:hypothetical protein
VGLILGKGSAMWISIPVDLSSRSFIPLPCFIRSRRATPLLAPYNLAMRVTIPIDLSTRSFIPLPRSLNSRRVSPLLNQSLVLIPEQSAFFVLMELWLPETFVSALLDDTTHVGLQESGTDARLDTTA